MAVLVKAVSVVDVDRPLLLLLLPVAAVRLALLLFSFFLTNDFMADLITELRVICGDIPCRVLLFIAVIGVGVKRCDYLLPPVPPTLFRQI